MPATDLIARHSAPLGGGGAVEYEVLQLCHRLGVSRDDSCEALLRAKWGADSTLANVVEVAVMDWVIFCQALVDGEAVLASVKVRNLKANHSVCRGSPLSLKAVLVSVKVRNLKANHSVFDALSECS